MFCIEIRVDEGKKEALLEALIGPRQDIDFKLQVANEQDKQSVTDPGKDRSKNGCKENCMESTGRMYHSNATTL